MTSKKDPDGETRWFLINSPKGEHEGKRPGLINIHGVDDSPEGIGQNTGLWKLAPEAGVVVAHP